MMPVNRHAAMGPATQKKTPKPFASPPVPGHESVVLSSAAVGSSVLLSRCKFEQLEHLLV